MECSEWHHSWTCTAQPESNITTLDSHVRPKFEHMIASASLIPHPTTQTNINAEDGGLNMINNININYSVKLSKGFK